MDISNLPIHMDIDTLLLILGPSTSHMSNSQEYENGGEDYDSSNAYDFRLNSLKIHHSKLTKERIEKLK